MFTSLCSEVLSLKLRLFSSGSVRIPYNLFIPSVVLSILSIIVFGVYIQNSLYYALWFGVVLSFASVLFGILGSKRETEKLLSIALFLFSLRTLLMWRNPSWGFTAATDSSYGVQLSNTINAAGIWCPGQGLLRTEIEYSFYPAVQVWTVMFRQATGLDMVFTAQLLFPALCGTLTVVFYYLALRTLLSREVALWASFIFCLNPMFIFFDGTYVHEAFALVFYALFLMIVFRVYFGRQGNRRLFIIGILAIFAVVLSHHWTSYNLIIVSLVFLFLPKAYSYLLTAVHHTNFVRRSSISTRFVVMIVLCVLFWVAFIASYVLSRQSEAAAGFVLSVINPISHRFTVLVTHNIFESGIIILGVLVLIALGSAQLLIRLTKRDKSRLDFVLESWFIFSAIYMYSLTFGSKAFYFIGSLWERAWPFAFFGVSTLIAMSIAGKNGLSRKLIPRIRWRKLPFNLKPLILIFPLVSAMLQAPAIVLDTSRFFPGDSYFSTALWVKERLSNETITVDSMSYLVLVPYGRVNFYPGSIYLFDASMSAIYEFQDPSQIPKEWQEWRILVFNKNISNWYPEVSTNSSRLEMFCNRVYATESLVIFIIQIG
jgi:hypothetical protein